MTMTKSLFDPAKRKLMPFAPYVRPQAPEIPLPHKLLTFNASDLKTGATPSASGSAYLELESLNGSGFGSIKLACTVYGPKSLPRSAPFSPHMVLSTHVKYAPFATSQRKRYIRDSTEQDLSVHLETALRGAIIVDRWPKSGVDVVVTIIEGELADCATTNPDLETVNEMNILSGCINVAAAAIADAGIDSVDTISGGVSALVMSKSSENEPLVVADPMPADELILASCFVAYLPARNEIASLWLKGRLPSGDNVHQRLIAGAVHASKGTSQAQTESIKIT